MATLRALVVGVSYYHLKGVNDLPFCKNDIQAISAALAEGLNVRPSDIHVCGETGTVTFSEFTAALHDIAAISESDDSLIMYFSGHGSTKDGKHYLVLSDSKIGTQDIIFYLESIKAKNKILFLDCCMAGNFEIGETASFDIDQAVEDFVGRGYAVIAACNAEQYSYGHPDKPVSVFTNILCQALSDKVIIREGQKSLYDIHRLLFLLLEIWNSNHPDIAQTPIYRANMGGTIYFKVQDYHPYKIKSFFDETERYVISSVESSHSDVKRYSVKVVLKYPFSLNEIAEINHEIIGKVKYLDIYSNARQEDRWKGKPANIVFCYYGLDESDIANSNFICHTTWADETQDKNYWYRIGKGEKVLDDVRFSIPAYYGSFKSFIADHTAVKEQLIRDTRAIISQMVTLAEQVISYYNEYINAEKTESELINDISGIIPQLDKLYLAEGDLDFPPNELEAWSQCCSNLAAAIHDFTLFYNPRYLSMRTSENRKACMDMTIKRYYRDLEKIKEAERFL